MSSPSGARPLESDWMRSTRTWPLAGRKRYPFRRDWFEAVYNLAEGDPACVPWANLAPHPLLAEWLSHNDLAGKRALDVGCGLGDNAEALARSGARTVAFDLSDRAIEWARDRFPGTSVSYRSADLFDAPPEWAGAFDSCTNATRCKPCLRFFLHRRLIRSLRFRAGRFSSHHRPGARGRQVIVNAALAARPRGNRRNRRRRVEAGHCRIDHASYIANELACAIPPRLLNLENGRASFLIANIIYWQINSVVQPRQLLSRATKSASG